LAGDTLYKSRRERIRELLTWEIFFDPLGVNIDIREREKTLLESERQRTLAQFFRMLQKALELERKTAEGRLEKSSMIKPWQSETPIHTAFLKRIENALRREVETPKQEFSMAIFRRGLEKLLREMREPGKGREIPRWKIALYRFFERFGLDLQSEQRKLVEILNLHQLKKELEELRREGNLAEIIAKEREIADKIQEVVSKFPYKSFANNPSEMIAEQYINCVGASILGGALMKEAGLNYLVGATPGHSVLLLVTSNGEIELRDMLLSPLHKIRLANEMIQGQRRDGKPLRIWDIVNFSINPKPEGLSFKIGRGNQNIFLTIFSPEYGEYIQLLCNTGYTFQLSGHHEEAVEIYRQIISLTPNCPSTYGNLSLALYNLGHYEEAIEACKEAIGKLPEQVELYNTLGFILVRIGRYEEGIEVLRRAIDINPFYPYPYFNLGFAFYRLARYEEAIISFLKFIDRTDKEKDKDLIEEAENAIKKIEEELMK